MISNTMLTCIAGDYCNCSGARECGLERSRPRDGCKESGHVRQLLGILFYGRFGGTAHEKTRQDDLSVWAESGWLLFSLWQSRLWGRVHGLCVQLHQGESRNRHWEQLSLCGTCKCRNHNYCGDRPRDKMKNSVFNVLTNAKMCISHTPSILRILLSVSTLSTVP